MKAPALNCFLVWKKECCNISFIYHSLSPWEQIKIKIGFDMWVWCLSPIGIISISLMICKLDLNLLYMVLKSLKHPHNDVVLIISIEEWQRNTEKKNRINII